MSTKTEQRRILVINDTPDIVELFHDILSDEGYHVVSDVFPINPTAKLAEIKGDRPHLIILDLIIGGEPLGFQFLQMLKMDRTTHRIPVILCTAAHQQAAEMEAHLLEMGVAVILKPFDIDGLLAEITKAWNTREP
jgi:DNA-binding response OmpR family regulator